MAKEILSTTEYAALREVSPRAIQKICAMCIEDKIKFPNRQLPGVSKIEKRGRINYLHMRNNYQEIMEIGRIPAEVYNK